MSNFRDVYDWYVGKLANAQKVFDPDNPFRSQLELQHGSFGSQLALAHHNNEFNAAQAQKQQDFQKEMSSTAHQREVKDLQAAGLNPILSAGGQGASSPAGSSAEASGEVVSSVASMANEMMGSLTAITNQINSARAARERAELEAELKRAQMDYNLQIAQMQSRTQLEAARIAAQAAADRLASQQSHDRYMHEHYASNGWQAVSGLLNRFFGDDSDLSYVVQDSSGWHIRDYKDDYRNAHSGRGFKSSIVDLFT